jgi:hypothetical protein
MSFSYDETLSFPFQAKNWNEKGSQRKSGIGRLAEPSLPLTEIPCQKLIRTH